MSIHQFNFPTHIQFGPAASRAGIAHLKEKRFTRPLVVTDAGVAPLAFFKTFVDSVHQSGLSPAVYSKISGNPVTHHVTDGVKAFHDHHADCLIAIGGGAALDVAKAIVLMAFHPGDLFDYEDGKADARPIDKEIPYWIALPTTAGTGSEVGRSAVISDEKTHVKKIVFSPRLLAPAVFADPELTLELPAKVTASTGMDALTHCVESFLAKGYHPICDGIALEGLRLAAENLKRAVRQPLDREARAGMLMSSMMGAIAFQKGLGLTHSCAHSLSTVHDLHHGLANGIMIDHALRFNVPAVADRFRRLAQTVGIDDQTGDGFLRWLADLKTDIGIPAKLGAVGVTKASIDRLSELAFADGCHQCNPRACTQADFRAIFTEAI